MGICGSCECGNIIPFSKRPKSYKRIKNDCELLTRRCTSLTSALDRAETHVKIDFDNVMKRKQFLLQCLLVIPPGAATSSAMQIAKNDLKRCIEAEKRLVLKIKQVGKYKDNCSAWRHAIENAMNNAIFMKEATSATVLMKDLNVRAQGYDRVIDDLVDVMDKMKETELAITSGVSEINGMELDESELERELEELISNPNPEVIRDALANKRMISAARGNNMIEFVGMENIPHGSARNTMIQSIENTSKITSNTNKSVKINSDNECNIIYDTERVQKQPLLN